MRGRPTFSPIRNNLVELLYFMGSSYGYDIYKKYMLVFPKTTMRSMYYHLNKGVKLGVFSVSKIETVKGDYSWGEGVRRVNFKLGPNAKPRKDTSVLKKLKNTPNP